MIARYGGASACGPTTAVPKRKSKHSLLKRQRENRRAERREAKAADHRTAAQKAEARERMTPSYDGQLHYQ